MGILTSRRRDEPSQARTVLCHGVFDLVHPGHIEHLLQARNFGHILVVSITADKYVNKGPNRPYFNENQRSSFLAALQIVDYVYIVDSDSALPAINNVKPDFYVKGPDYKILENDITGKISLERAEVEKNGGRIVFTDGFTSSSTTLINNYLSPKDDKVRVWANKIKKKFSLEEIISWIDKLKEIDVNILGETIIDAYTECRALAKSSKDPILAFHRFETQKFLGGVLAIADSCSRWSKKTYVYSTCGNDYQKLLNEVNSKIEFEQFHIQRDESMTILKHRFVDVISGNRVFEYYDFNPEVLDEKIQNKIVTKVREKLQKSNLFLLADYGHGFFGESIIEAMCDSRAFLAVNTQSNAGNRGFNTFSKYARIDFLCLNGGELELELRKRELDYFLVLPNIMKEKGCKNAVVTLGGEGLLTFDSSGDWFHSPALATKVVDKVGAGDSVLAIASMLAFLDAPKEVIGLLASVVAAFEVSQLGHKKSLDIVGMKKYVNGLLG